MSKTYRTEKTEDRQASRQAKRRDRIALVERAYVKPATYRKAA